jgi:hypothetical protein
MRFSTSVFIGLVAFAGLAAADKPYVAFDGPPPCTPCTQPDCTKDAFNYPTILKKADNPTKFEIARYTDDNNKVNVTIASSMSMLVAPERAFVSSNITECSLVTLENTPKSLSDPVTFYIVEPKSTCILDLKKMDYDPSKEDVVTLYEKGQSL